jgi:hypothetical protein
MEKRLPEIFIVGTMKGGTTILYDYICTHPRVVPGARKEVHYFSLEAHRPIEWYKDQFPARAETTLSIDASPSYFDLAAMPMIPACIKREVPGARVIVIVRDPVARAISHFQHLRTVSEKERFAEIDINEFFGRPLDRYLNPIKPSDYNIRDVLEFSIYDEKYSNYTRIFGRENVLALTNEGLWADPLGTMRQVFAHCGLEWVSSEKFGVADYLSGSEKLPVSDEARRRLGELLYPSYERFLRRSGLPPRVIRSAK